GKIEDSLPKGKYTIAVLGNIYNNSYLPDYTGGNVSMYSVGGDDVFFAQFDFEVTGEAITQTLELVRKAGKIEINLIDKIPAEIQKIVYKVSGVSYYFDMYNNIGSTSSSIYNQNDYYTYEYIGYHPDYTQDFDLYFFLDQHLPSIGSV